MGWKVSIRGNPLVLLLTVLLLVWFLLFVIVGAGYLHDRHGAYQGRVVDIKSRTFLDHVALEFVIVEHLILETPEGKTVDKMVGVEDRAFFRIEVGDLVIKEQGFGNHARVPGKPTAQEMLDSIREIQH